jgi:hypothetical protein
VANYSSLLYNEHLSIITPNVQFKKKLISFAIISSTVPIGLALAS